MAKLKIEDVAKVSKPGTKPMYSPWGYIVRPDGTVLAMYERWYHGVLLAFIYPEKLASFRLEHPVSVYNEKTEDFDKIHTLQIPEDREDINVFQFQEFEHSICHDIPDIRVCPNRMLSPFNLDRGNVPATKEQQESLRAIFSCHSLTGNDVINTSWGDTYVKDIWSYLETGEVVRIPADQRSDSGY